MIRGRGSMVDSLCRQPFTTWEAPAVVGWTIGIPRRLLGNGYCEFRAGIVTAMVGPRPRQVFKIRPMPAIGIAILTVVL